MITNNFLYRNFLNQTGDFYINWTISIDNITGSGTFGISGTGNNYTYTIKSGEIYDPYNNLLGSYESDEPFSIRNDIINNKDTLYYNNNPKFFFKAGGFFGGHNYNYFFVNPTGLTLDIDFFIRGEATTLQVSGLNTRSKNDNINEIVNIVTGRIINNKPQLNVKIFDGFIANNPQFTLSGLPMSFYDTGYFYIVTDSGTTEFNNRTFTLPITFNTNYGPVSFDFSFNNQYIPLQFSSLIVIPSGNVNIFDNEVLGFDVRYGSSSGAYLDIELTYISGTTGFFTGNILGTGYVNDVISGIITGSGFIEKVINTSVILTGYNPYGAINDSAPITGINIKEFVYATGDVEYYYSITGTGLGSGYRYLTIPSSGQITVSVSGNVPYVGGGPLFYTTGGFISTGYSLDIDNNSIQITGFSDSITSSIVVFYTGDISGVFLDSGQYISKLFSGGHTGSLEGVSITGQTYYDLATGYGTGINRTGIVNSDFFRFFEGGNYFFTKVVTGISGFFSLTDSSRVITGLSGLLNCKSNENSFNYSGIGKITGINKFNLFLDECDNQTPMFYFLATGNPLEDFKLYTSQGDKVIAEEDIDKFIIIGVTGNEVNFTYLENLENLTGNPYGTGIRTRISHLGNTASGSGYFSGIFSEGACENEGIWEHEFVNFTTTTGLYYTNNYISKQSFKVISAEDNIMDNFNSIKFNIL